MLKPKNLKPQTPYKLANKSQNGKEIRNLPTLLLNTKYKGGTHPLTYPNT